MNSCNFVSFSSRGKEKSGLLISFGFEDDEESRISAGDEESAGIPISKSISVVPVVPPVIQPEMHSAEPQTKDMKQLAQAQLQPKESRLLSVDELIAKHVARKSLPGRYLIYFFHLSTQRHMGKCLRMHVIIKRVLPITSGNVHRPRVIFYILFCWPF